MGLLVLVLLTSEVNRPHAVIYMEYSVTKTMYPRDENRETYGS